MAFIFGAKRSLGPAPTVGLFYLSVWRGKLVVRKWPRHRKRRRTTDEREREEQFARIASLVKRQAPKIQAYVQEAVKVAPIYARDMLTQAAYGRFVAAYVDDGRVLYGEGAREDVSNALNALGLAVGSILVRYADQWWALPPGGEGQALTMVAGFPTWADLPG